MPFMIRSNYIAGSIQVGQGIRLFKKKFLLTFLCWGILFPTQAQHNPYSFHVDSFRQVIVNGFLLNSPIRVDDTLLFLRQGLYAFVNYDNTCTFEDVLMCYEPGYRKLTDPNQHHFDLSQLRMKRDIRILFLFFLVRYVLGSKLPLHSSKLHKLSTIQLLETDSRKEYDVYGVDGGDHIIALYRALILSIDKKNFQEFVIRQPRVSLLEFIGFDWWFGRVTSRHNTRE